MQTKITQTEKEKGAYPITPFVTSDGIYFNMVVASKDGTFVSVNLTDGYFPPQKYCESLDEYFETYPDEVIVESEIIIKK